MDFLFASRLRVEVQSESFLGIVRNGLLEEAFYTLRLADSEPSFLLFHNEGSSCSLWKCILKDDKMTTHMEDEVGIYDSAGLYSFASYFSEALLGGPSIEKSAEYFPVSPSSNVLALKLTYYLGSMQMEGLLKFDLIQKEIDPTMLLFIKASFATDFSKQKSPAPRISLTESIPFSSQFTSLDCSISSSIGLMTNSGESAVVVPEEPVEPEPIKAKKRKVGGVNIFPGKKR